MNEESQVRGCYNITFICTPTRKQCKCPLNEHTNTGRNSKQTTCLCRDTGGKGTLRLLLSWCLMSSDVIWHIRDKLWPMPKHGSIRKVYACLAVTCHLHFWQNDRDFLRATVVTRGWNGYRNKSQHRKSTLEKKILPPFQQGFEPATFQSRVRRSNHWAIPAPWTLRAQRTSFNILDNWGHKTPIQSKRKRTGKKG